MKKNLFIAIFVIVALLACVTNLTAQEKSLTFGIKGGVNYSDFSGDLKDTKGVLKYQFGITADLAFSQNVYLLIGLEVHTKGSKVKTSGTNIKYNPMYLQIPLHVAYKFDIADNKRLVIGVGPYAAYGISGKIKADEKENIFEKNRFKRFDFGLGGSIGFEFGKVVFTGGYDFGLFDISDVKDAKLRNRNAYLTLGYKF